MSDNTNRGSSVDLESALLFGRHVKWGLTENRGKISRPNLGRTDAPIQSVLERIPSSPKGLGA